MSVELVIALVGVLFLVLLMLECPVAFALGGSGGVGLLLLRDTSIVTATFASVPYNATADYGLSLIPMYVLIGMFALHGRLAERLFALASTAMRRIPGGIGIATVGACAGFAAVTGSSVATAATLGKLSVSEMQRYGYPASLASGIIAAAGTLGVLIPPSVVLVFYGILARESIAQLLLAGIVPGALSALLYVLFIGFRARNIQPPDRLQDVVDGAAGISPEDAASPSRFTRAESLRAVGWLSVIFLVILAGIYTGQFTVIESGAMGALTGLVMLLTERGRAGARALWEDFRDAILEASSVTSMAFAILVGATVFSAFLVTSRIPMRLEAWVDGLEVPAILVVILMLAMLVPLGMVLETLSIIVITVPLLHPIVTGLGFEGIWFAIVFVKMIEIGLVTPPVGMNAYVVAGASGVPVETTFRGVAPFIGVDVLTVALLVAVPGIVTWLPAMVGT